MSDELTSLSLSFFFFLPHYTHSVKMAPPASITPSIEEGKLLSEALATVHTQLVQLKRCLVSHHHHHPHFSLQLTNCLIGL